MTDEPQPRLEDDVQEQLNELLETLSAEAEEGEEELDWLTEIESFVQGLPEGVQQILDGAPIVESIMHFITTLYQESTASRENIPMLYMGFGSGVLAALLSTRSELIHQPQLAKDLAVHYTSAFVLTLLSNDDEIRAEQEAMHAEESQPTETNPETEETEET